MSKIGNYYLELTEQANELGFDTVEEAFDAGYEVHMGKLQLKDEQTKAHEAWLKEREEVISGLKRMLDLWKEPYTDYELAYALGQYQDNIGKAIEFIERGDQ